MREDIFMKINRILHTDAAIIISIFLMLAAFISFIFITPQGGW